MPKKFFMILLKDLKKFLNILLTIDIYSKLDLREGKDNLNSLLVSRKVNKFIRFPDDGTYLVLNNSVFYILFLELITTLSYPSDYFNNEMFLTNNLKSLLTIKREYKKIVHLMLRFNQHDDLQLYNIYNRNQFENKFQIIWKN